jgi:hypothetical protein
MSKCGNFKRSQVNLQVDKYHCSFHPRVFQGIVFWYFSAMMYPCVEDYGVWTTNDSRVLRVRRGGIKRPSDLALGFGEAMGCAWLGQVASTPSRGVREDVALARLPVKASGWEVGGS